MRRPAHVLLLALVPACYDPSGYETLLEYYTTEDSDSDSDSDDSANSSPPISTVTTEPPPHGSDSDSDASSAGDTGDDTEGALPAPQIIEHELTPGPIIFKNGPLTVTVTAEGAEGVSMQLEDGSVIELAALDPDFEQDPAIFQGELAVNTGLANGTQILGLTPWRGDLVGDTITTSYKIALPKPGAEIFWQANDLIGGGIVKALGVLPSGDPIEFGQYTQDNESRCYLRRRDPGGWNTVLRDVLPGLTCAPIDMKIDADGAITLLAYRTGVGGTEWWLGQLSSWDAGVTPRGLGGKDELALALGAHPSGLIAVCGAAPSGHPDAWDAAAWIYRPNQFGETRTFDYFPEDDKPHKFTEIARDCAFAGDTFVMVGEAHGKHENADQSPKRDRHFLLEFDLVSKAHKWNVGGIEGTTQTGGRALAIDDQGRYITAGFFCGDDCDPKATLRVHDPKGGDDWFAPIGDLPSLSYGPHDIAWSPAGYAVVVMGGAKGNEGAFWVRALKPGSAAPLWTYSREDNKNFHMAIAVAIGAFGEVYAGGLGNNGYPAVAHIGG
ncbi:MAG: hypothetical protein IPK80_16150 [Nannocystis sp.]|nr:hypothetical protein [Nannocystis sp.]